jgi:hypothetical protein
MKNLIWSLWRKDSENWACLPNLLQIVEDEDEFKVMVEAREWRQPNATETSKRRHL